MRRQFVYVGGGGSRGREHRRIAERALGKPLPPGAVVHHWDENGTNNEPSNLVICPNEAYHKLLHRRMRALKACGHADWRKCQRCMTFAPPETMAIYGRKAVHPACAAAYTETMRQKRKAQ